MDLLDRAPGFARRILAQRVAGGANALADRAMQARRAGDWVGAARAWRTALAAAPNRPTWRLRAVEAAARAGLVDEAEDWARSLPDDAKVKGEAALSAAQALIDIGRYDEATAVLQLATGLDVNRAWLLALSAHLKLLGGEFDEAWRVAEEAKQTEDPTGKTARVLKRAGLAGQRPASPVKGPDPAPTPAEAEDIAASLGAMETVLDSRSGDEILDEAPSPAGPAELLERLYARIEIPQALRPALPEAADTPADSGGARVSASVAEAELLAATGNLEGARRRLKRLVARAPQSIPAALALARVLTTMDDLKGAEASLRNAVALDPVAERPRMELARHLMRPGLYAEAAREWQILYAQGAGRGEPLIQLARCLQKLDLHPAAVSAYQILADEMPLHVEARLGKARSLTAMGDARAADAWREALELDPGLEEAGLELARILSQQGDHDGAVRSVEGVIAHSRPSDRLMAYKARMLRAARQHAAAIELLRRLVAERPESAGLRLELARTVRETGDDQATIEACASVLELDPANSEASRALSETYEKLENLDAAFSVWERRAAAVPTDWEPWVYMARLQRRQQLRAEAIQSYLRATEVAPAEVRVVSEAARYISNATVGLYEGLTLANRWLNLVPDSSDAFVCRAQIHLTLRDYDASDADLEAALRLAPTSVNALMAKAKRLYAQSRWADAEPVARAWREASGNSSDATDLLARCLSNQGFNAQAEALYREQRDANPGDIRAVLAVAEFCRRDRKLDDAVALWREALQIDPASAVAWTNLVSSLANADREAEALADFATAQQNMGEDAEALLHYAVMLDRGRFIDMADAAYRRAVAAAPGTAAAPRNYGRFLAGEGRLSEALKAFSLAREADPKSWELALELIDVIEGLALFGHPDPAAVLKGPDLGYLIPERLFELVVAAADSIEPYEPVPGRVMLFTQSLAAGGAERQLAASATGLADRPGVDVHVSCLALDPNLGRDFYAGAIRAAGAPIWSATPEEIAEAWEDPVVQQHREILRRLPPDMGPVAWWVAQIRKLKPEVVHPWQDMTSLSVSLAATLAGAPRILLGTRSVRPDNPRRRLRRWMRHAYQQILRRPNVELMANSAAGGADYADWLGIDPGRVKVVYNGLAFSTLRKDASPTARAEIRKQLGVPPEAPLIGGVFRMSEEKRPMLWMEAAGLVAKARPDAHFVVCGAGPFYEEMAAYAEQEGFADRMHLPGVQPHIGRWFAAMDAVLLTSRHEGLPNVLIEAQSLGVPVVVPAVGGAPEVLLDGETGFAIPKATAADLAAKLLFILEDDAWRERAHKTAPEFVAARFSQQRMVDATLEVYFPDGPPAPKPAPRTRARAKTTAGAKPIAKATAKPRPTRVPPRRRS